MHLGTFNSFVDRYECNDVHHASIVAMQVHVGGGHQRNLKSKVRGVLANRDILKGVKFYPGYTRIKYD